MIRSDHRILLVPLIAIFLSHTVIAHADVIGVPGISKSVGFDNQTGYFDLRAIPFYLFLTIMLESFFAGIYVFFVRLPKKAILLVVSANIILYPFAWLTFTRLPLSYEAVVCMVEVFAVVSEAVFMYLIAKRIRSLEMLSLRHAFAMSFIMNMGSFLSGFLI